MEGPECVCAWGVCGVSGIWDIWDRVMGYGYAVGVMVKVADCIWDIWDRAGL